MGDRPSGGEQRVEVVMHRGAQVEFLGLFEQTEFGERFAERGKHRFPGIPLAQDVVAGLVGGGAFGEVAARQARPLALLPAL